MNNFFTIIFFIIFVCEIAFAKNYNKGDSLSCIIFGIDAERERISLKISD